MKYLIFIFSLFVKTNIITAQKQLSIAYQQRYGFIIPHRASIAYLVENHIVGYDLQISKQFNDTLKDWQVLYKYPLGGVGMYFSNLGNREVAGNAFSFYSFINIPVFKTIAFFNISIGLAYLTKYFDYQKNYTNIVISTPLNVFISLGILKEICLKKFCICPGISFTHFSNGSWSKPNLGFNIPSLNLKIKYGNNKSRMLIPLIKLKSYKEYGFFIACGIRQNLPQTPHFIVNTLAFNYNNTRNHKFKYGCGFDLFYDPSIIPRTQNIPNYDNYYPYLRIGMRGNLIMIIGKTELLFQSGFYIYDKKLPDGPIYSRIGINFNIYRNLQFNIWLKSHFFRADVIEWGMTWFFRKNKN
ncbi:MAG: acyloxyacyl hydrolase [Bacteroidales bacterium]|nr:acyloxyacyl hydrolase [Bacteroidales bacterium]